MNDRKARAAPRPLDIAKLDELALCYVGKYATTRAKLRDYLKRKIRERGWVGPEPDIAAMAERFAQLGYVDDSAYALIKSRSLAARGYGKRRLSQQLRVAGIEAGDAAAAAEHADAESVAAALRFAQRRRLGPFAPAAADPRSREKALAAMIRAGHSFAIARTIVDWPPVRDARIETLEEEIRFAAT